MRPRVLIVGMLDSVHLAGWLSHFHGVGVEFLLFPSGPHRRIHKEIRELLGARSDQFSLSFGSSMLGLPCWLLDRVFGNRVRAFFLRRAVRRWRPSVVHAVEIQNAGYLCLRAFRGRARNFDWGATNYGSDIFWFSRFSKHRHLIVELLESLDFYSAECDRDVELAINLGFRGLIKPVFPNSGGIPDHLFFENNIERGTRDAITVKGYQGWAGQAIVALKALERISERLPISQLYVHSANLHTKLFIWRMRRKVSFRIEVFSKGALTRTEVIRHLSRSIVFVGISKTDGISTTMLEAMAAGAIPVQTATSCCGEWFGDKSGAAVREVSVEAVADSVRKALVMAETSHARQENWATVSRKGLRSTVSARAQLFYETTGPGGLVQ